MILKDRDPVSKIPLSPANQEFDSRDWLVIGTVEAATQEHDAPDIGSEPPSKQQYGILR